MPIGKQLLETSSLAAPSQKSPIQVDELWGAGENSQVSLRVCCRLGWGQKLINPFRGYRESWAGWPLPYQRDCLLRCLELEAALGLPEGGDVPHPGVKRDALLQSGLWRTREGQGPKSQDPQSVKGTWAALTPLQTPEATRGLASGGTVRDQARLQWS